jgi:transposase
MVSAAGALPVTAEQRGELERLSRSHTAPAREVRQARALLWAADGVPNAEIARRCASTPKSVRRWRARFDEEGLRSVGRIRPGRGRRPVIDDAKVAAIVHDTLHTVPEDGAVAWTTRTLGDRHGVGKDTVARIWRSRGLRPWKVDIFKLSTDPAFEDKLIETWFSVLTRKALTNTSFTSVAELEARVDWWVSHWNDHPEPFIWTRTADEPGVRR